MDKLNFNKRIILTKRGTFNSLIENKDLDNIAGTNDKGYYTLKSIFKALYPMLEKYSVDLELTIDKDKILGVWYDCESDKTREVWVDFSSLVGLERLPSMKNIVQSDGAVKTYIRRYALTNILGLNSTDIIENGTGNEKRYSNNKTSKNASSKTDDKETKTEEKIRALTWYTLKNFNKKDEDKCKEELKKLTTFEGKNGTIEGIDDINKLRGQRLKILYGKVKKIHENEFKTVEKWLENKDKAKKKSETATT